MTRHTYSESGVDIDAGNRLVKKIAPLAAATRRAGSETSHLGGFGGLFDLAATGFTDPVLVAATDGVGTKLRVAIDTGHHTTVGIDLVAMCVNDLVVQGAEPLFFLDYFATGKLSVDTAEAVITGIAEGCRQAGAALIGGETAEMPGHYVDGDYDLAGFAVGAVERGAILPRGDIGPGAVILGLASSGVHSNGFSLVRRIVAAEGLDYALPAPFDTERTLGAALLAPTRIYVSGLVEQARQGRILGLAHITGGGLLENIPRILPPGTAAMLDANAWPLPPVFGWLKRAGDLDDMELARTFNCGIGMAVIVTPEMAESVEQALTGAGETVYRIGTVEQAAHGAGPEVTLSGTGTTWAI